MSEFVNEKPVESPLGNWPGYIVLPVELTPEQFEAVFARERAFDEEKGVEDALETGLMRVFWVRFPLVLGWHVKGIVKEPEPSGRFLPSRKLAAWVIDETSTLIEEAKDPPELRPPSADSTNGAE